MILVYSYLLSPPPGLPPFLSFLSFLLCLIIVAFIVFKKKKKTYYIVNRCQSFLSHSCVYSNDRRDHSSLTLFSFVMFVLKQVSKQCRKYSSYRLACLMTSIDDEDVLCFAFGVEIMPTLLLLLFGRGPLSPLLLKLLSLRTTIGAMNSPLSIPALLRPWMLAARGVRGSLLFTAGT